MEPFKNNISSELVSCFADHLEKHLASFNRNQFESAIVDELDRLELKERAQLIADQLHSVLPTDHKTRHRILLDMLHPLEDADNGMQSDGQGIRGWGMMPLCAVVGQHGLETFDESMDVLKQMTSRFSSELDVRYFLLADQERALEIMTGWIDDPNRHVRRLVSEGTRPRLPWAMQLPRLISDPSPVLPLLEKLRDDKEEYVRRSVANHLNDISKDHPDLVGDLTQSTIYFTLKSTTENFQPRCSSGQPCPLRPRQQSICSVATPSAPLQHASITRASKPCHCVLMVRIMDTKPLISISDNEENKDGC